MAKNYSTTILIAFITVGFFKVDETQAENSNAKFSSEYLKPFNPFDVRSWYNLSAQFMKFWFPYFQPVQYPPYWQKPTTTTTTTPAPIEQIQTEKVAVNSKPSNNIFGMGPIDDTVEYLPAPNEIEW